MMDKTFYTGAVQFDQWFKTKLFDHFGRIETDSYGYEISNHWYGNQFYLFIIIMTYLLMLDYEILLIMDKIYTLLGSHGRDW